MPGVSISGPGPMYSRCMKRGARPLVSPAPRSWRGGIAAALVAWLLLVGMTAAGAAPRQVGEHRWEGVGRIVAIGDVHGDYDNYMAALRLAGIVDRHGRWSAGAAHLVQTGDIADRGPDSRRIISHMKRLRRDARRQGGRVHHLLGNHEAMNVLGDLRYVSDGEYRAFVDRHSRALRERYYRAWLEALETGDPGAAGALAPDHRETWEREHPLGWVEHRLAWDPRWDPSGELFRWAMEAAVAVQQVLQVDRLAVDRGQAVQVGFHAAQGLGGDVLELQCAHGLGDGAVDDLAARGDLAHAVAQRVVDGRHLLQHLGGFRPRLA